MKKITYNNKQYVLNDPQYPVEKTVTDTDMNEIKEVVNFNADETLEENIKIKEQLERTKDALINITTEKSSSITVKDSSSLPAKIDVYGTSSQKTRSGKNMINVIANSSTVNGVTFTNNKDGTVTINGTATANTYYNLNNNAENYFTLTKNNTYAISLIETVLGLNLVVRSVSKNYSLISTGTGIVENTKQYTDDTDNQCYAYLMINSGTTINNLKVYPILVEGSEVGEFEQYGASPSPEFPSEIENVTGDIDITVCNKNFLNVNSECKVAGSKRVAIKMPIGTYTIKADDIVTDSEQTQFCFSFKDSSGTIADARISLSTKKITFALTREATSVVIYSGNSFNESQGVTTTYKNLMIYEGTGDEQYTEHEQQLITFPLQKGQKLYNGDYLASDGIHHVRKQVEFDGTENWFQHETTKVFGFVLSDIKTEGAFNSSARIVVMSNYFKAAKYYQLYYGEVDEAISGHNSSHAVELRATRFATVEELKTWLAQQKAEGTPVILEYELAEEEIEPYTPEQQEAYNKLQNVLSYKTVTNVFTNQGLLEFKYIADTKTYIDNKYNNLAQQFLNL